MNKKIIYVFLSVLLVALCIVTGTTYAYFSNEKTTDINASSEKLIVDLETSNFKMYSNDVEVKDTFTNGGYATLSQDGYLNIVNMAQNDKITFTLNFKNNSTNNVLYRMRDVVYDDYISYKKIMVNPLPHKWNEIAKGANNTFEVVINNNNSSNIEELNVQYYIDVLPVDSKDAYYSNVIMNEALYGVYEFDSIEKGSAAIESAGLTFIFNNYNTLEKYDESLPQKIALIKTDPDELGLPSDYPGTFFRIDIANIKLVRHDIQIVWEMNNEVNFENDYKNAILKLKTDETTLAYKAETVPLTQDDKCNRRSINITLKTNYNEMCSSDFTTLCYFGYATVN